MELRLPLEVDKEPGPDTRGCPDLSGGRRSGCRRSQSGNAAPIWTPEWVQTEVAQTRGCCYLTLQNPIGSYRVGSGDGWRKFGISNLTCPGLAQVRSNAGIQQVKLTPDQVAFGLPLTALRSSENSYRVRRPGNRE